VVVARKAKLIRAGGLVIGDALEYVAGSQIDRFATRDAPRKVAGDTERLADVEGAGARAGATAKRVDVIELIADLDVVKMHAGRADHKHRNRRQYRGQSVRQQRAYALDIHIPIGAALVSSRIERGVRKRDSVRASSRSVAGCGCGGSVVDLGCPIDRQGESG